MAQEAFVRFNPNPPVFTVHKSRRYSTRYRPHLRRVFHEPRQLLALFRRGICPQPDALEAWKQRQDQGFHEIKQRMRLGKNDHGAALGFERFQ
jgi:hypothetical protein